MQVSRGLNQYFGEMDGGRATNETKGKGGYAALHGTMEVRVQGNQLRQSFEAKHL